MRVHQNIILNGEDIGDRADRKYSKFCNEGKWDNFINPLLPEDNEDMTLVEMGSNAGLFLKMAKEAGFKRVIGIESSSRNCKTAELYRDENNLDYEIINDSIGADFDYDALPLADIVLLPNFHYHLNFADFIPFMDQLKHKTVYCLVVSAATKNERVHWFPGWKEEDVRHYFREWEEVGYIERPSQEGDPHPREMFSILFRSPDLEYIDISDVLVPKGNRDWNRHTSWNEFAIQVLENDEFDFTESSYYAANMRMRRKKKWSQEKIDSYVKGKYDLLYDIKQNGIKTPIYIRSDDNRIIDGGHRLIMAKEMGYKRVIVRRI